MKRARWQLEYDDGSRELRVPPPYGTQVGAAEYLCWLLPDLAERGPEWVSMRLVRIDLGGPSSVVKVRDDLNALADRLGAIRDAGALRRKAGGQ